MGVIDGADNSLTTFPVSFTTHAGLVVNVVTNRVHAVADTGFGRAFVTIDGDTNAVTTTPIDFNPWTLAANAGMNRVYAGGTATLTGALSLASIDGNTGSATFHPLPLQSPRLAFNGATNRTYAIGRGEMTSQHELGIIDGATNRWPSIRSAELTEST